MWPPAQATPREPPLARTGRAPARSATVKPFLDMAQAGGLLFDGAMGTLLYDRGIFLTRSFEDINRTQPKLVRQIHEEYLQAGARVLTTNTFAANRLKLDRHGLGDALRPINFEAVKLAREAAGGRAHVAGSVGPTGFTFDQFVGVQGGRARAVLAEHIQTLVDAEVDLIVLETFPVLAELELAIELAVPHGLPVVALFMFQADGRGQQGHGPAQVGKRLVAAGAHVIGSNCGGGPELLYQVTTPMVGLGAPVLAMANAGRPEEVEGRTIYMANPEYFGVFTRRLLKAGVMCVGGCCGTTPEHTKRMANAVRMMSPAGETTPRIEPGSLRPAEGVEPVAVEDRSVLAARIVAGQFVTSVEINPPNGFDLTKQIAAATALRDAGVTTINIADGPRATLRMSNLAMAVEIERATGLQPILHAACRDRNFLGLQAHLLGAHVLGLRNLVVITGDPPKMGPYPHATGVYDVDSVGLLSVLDGYNRAVDPAGKAMPDTTRFFLITGAEPAAIDYDRELRRLEMKRDAGAQAVMTQPVYDLAKVERFLDDTQALGLPVLLGLCPLASHRNALFLHENVPGMQVPPYILARMKAADERGEGQAEGVRIAREALAAVRDRVQGAYIMPPFGRHKVALEVLDGYLESPSKG
ncbi:MAG: bifunctional homocysteine S-methyltransferase/methylenetetrahydrofolate reductase [Myxococcales bacterium]|nr:bifunctional homocysteine S-methyltransferase/methylenetetrahydrofolate reductase [Myxococcales bacterium]